MFAPRNAAVSAMVFAIIVVVSLPIPAREARPPARVAQMRAPFAPGVRWVHPSNRVAIACDACLTGPPPSWVKRLSTLLEARGFEPVPVPAAQASETAAHDFVSVAGPFPSEPDQAALDAAVETAESTVRQKAGECLPNTFLVVAPGLDAGRWLVSNISWVMWYSKLHADYLDVAEVGRVPRRFLDGYSAVVLAADSLPMAGGGRFARFLDDWVTSGGGLVALVGSPVELYRTFSIARAGEPSKVTSYACDGRWWPGAAGLTFELGEDGAEMLRPLDLAAGPAGTSGQEGRTDAGPAIAPPKVLCTGNVPGGRTVPLTVSAIRGAGRTLLWQGGMLAYRSARGRLLLSIMDVSPASAAVIQGAMLFFVDDCPRPMWGTSAPPIDKLYGVTDDAYYRALWWPRLNGLFDRFLIRPTFAFMWSYDRKSAPPFDSSMWGNGEDAPAREFARRLRDAGHEIGLHGYNHQSLTVATNDMSIGWPGRPEMEEALAAAREGMAAILGPAAVPRVYVAPHNLVQLQGKQAVHAVFPEVVAISTVYHGWGAVLPQEFGPDPDVEGVIDVPRVSSGHFLDPRDAHEILDALVLPGVFSHFIHPDEIFSAERSRGKDLEQMMAGLEQILQRVVEAYPFYRGMTGSEVAALIGDFGQMRVEVARRASSIRVRVKDGPAGGVAFLVKIPPEIRPKRSGCDELQAVPDLGRFYVRVGAEPCVLEW